MISRIAKQKKQDSDRQDDREPSSVKGEVMEIGTNKTFRDAEVRKKTPVAVRSNAAIETRDLRASSQEKKVDLGPTDHNHPSHFFYFPQNYLFPPHYSQPRYRSNPNHRNQSYRYSRPFYLQLPYQLPPSKPFEVTHDNDDDMAPFDDTTLATSNVSKKRKTGNLKIDTNLTMKHRNERFARPYSPPYYPPPSYGEFYPHPSPYHLHEDARSPQGPHFEFFDSDSPRDYEFHYSTSPIAVATPQRSNVTSQVEARDQSEGPEEDAKWKHDRTVPGHYDQPVPPPPPHKVRRQSYPPPFPPHNGWRAPYERPHESFSREEPYDRHYFCPSPPPPPPFPDNYVPSSDGFSSRAASPSMSWYEGSHGSFDEPIRPPAVPPYYSHPPGTYRYPYPPPQERQDKERPRTPPSNHPAQNMPAVTPAKPDGRNSLCPSNSNVKMEDQVPPLSKARTVTPDDKNRASTFAPSSPFGTLGDDDIVCGRGAPVNHHIGNERFRELVLGYNKSYFVAKRSEKPKIAMKILDVLASRGARFVRRIKGASAVAARWEEVSHKIAYEKVCQALRDAGGPNVKEMLASPSKRKASSPMRENGGSNKRQRLAYGAENTTARTGEEGKENGAVDQY